MALIKCPECGNEISEKAENCPKCGCPVSKKERVYEQISLSKEKEVRKVNIIGIIGSVLYGISIIFPLVKIDVFGFSYSMSLLEANSDFNLVLIIAIVSLIFSVLRLDKWNLVFGLGGFGFAIWEYTNISNNISNSTEYSGLLQLANIGAGMHLLFIGSVLIIISGILGTYNKIER